MQTGAAGRVDDAEVAAQAILTTSRVLVAVSARSIAVTDPDLSIPQFRVLVLIAAAGSRRPYDLADSLGISRSSATRLCDRLVSKDLISRTRDTEDRREVTLTLTPAGISLVQAVMARRATDIAAILERVAHDQRSKVIAGFRSFAEAAAELPDQGWATAWEL